MYNQLLEAAPSDVKEHVKAAPRDLKQVRNAQQRFRDGTRLTRDPIYELHELYYETDFISDVILFPNLVVLCYFQGTLNFFVFRFAFSYFLTFCYYM